MKTTAIPIYNDSLYKQCIHFINQILKVKNLTQQQSTIKKKYLSAHQVRMVEYAETCDWHYKEFLARMRTITNTELKCNTLTS